MKTMKRLSLLALLVAIFSTTACQKDTLPQQNNISKEKLVGTYKVTSMKLKGDNGAEGDLYTTLPDCQKQDRQTLNADLSYHLQNTCDPAENQTSTWAYISTKKITINGLTGNIVSFDGTNLVLSFENFLGMPGTLTETLTKQ